MAGGLSAFKSPNFWVFMVAAMWVETDIYLFTPDVPRGTNLSDALQQNSYDRKIAQPFFFQRVNRG